MAVAMPNHTAPAISCPFCFKYNPKIASSITTNVTFNPTDVGKPGAVFWKMHALYQDYKARVMRAPA